MKLVSRSATLAIVFSMVVPSSAMAEHLVGRAEIAGRLNAAAAERADNLLRIERLLSAHVLSAGLGALSDRELRDLASRADALEADPVAGGTTKTLLIIGAIVLVIVVLAALIVKNCKEQGAECLK